MGRPKLTVLSSAERIGVKHAQVRIWHDSEYGDSVVIDGYNWKLVVLIEPDYVKGQKVYVSMQ